MTSPACVSSFQVRSPRSRVTDEYIVSDYTYEDSLVTTPNGGTPVVRPIAHKYQFRVKRKVPRVGVLLVGIGGNNGTTVYGAIEANKRGISWPTKGGEVRANYFGSITHSATTYLGMDERNRKVFAPIRSLLPMVHANDLIIHGWDMNSMPLDQAMERAQVFPVALQRHLRPLLEGVRPMKSIYYPDFVASNQEDRADNVLPGTRACEAHVEHLRADIRRFREEHRLDTVIVLWTANTERYCEVTPGVHDSERNLLRAIRDGHEEVPPSQVFAVAALLEGCAYINGSPQNTFVPALVEMASRRGLFIGGDDFKSGQTKLKSVLVDFLVSSGLKPRSIVSYNHLGNNDGKNLAEYKQFRSKEISKSNVVDDMVNSNHILYPDGDKPDHCVVIKYVPTVQDSKRAMDEYIAEIFMHGMQTFAIHNTCEDSLLAAPLIIDLVTLCELFQRVEWRADGQQEWGSFRSILSVLSFLLKAPLVHDDSPLVNSLFSQKACIVNTLRACVGLPPVNDMNLQFMTGHLRSKM